MTLSSPPSIAPAFTLRLLGPFAAGVGGRPMGRLRSRKGQWILALLALRAGTAVERDWLAGILWPDSPEDKALYSLRRSLADLRQALESEAWRIEALTPRTLTLNLEGAQADIRVFDQGVTQADPALWRQAVAAYAGPLLEGCSEEWIFQERDWREEAYLQTLERLAAVAMQEGESAQAVEWLRQAVSAAPFRETAQRGLLQALAAQQDLAGVLLAYRELRLRLRRELNAAPDPETTALLQQIRRSARQRGEQVVTLPNNPLLLRDFPEESSRRELWEEAVTDLPLPPAHRLLPYPRTSFVGQRQVITDLCRSLAAHRLVTLMGTGGVGKTRLAIQAAIETADLYPGGTWLADLAPLHDPAMVLRAVAQALEVSDSPERSLLNAIIECLNGPPAAPRPPVLLIMDNCEHLLEACAGIVDTLLRNCPRLYLLATSQQALGLAGEMRCRIPSLPTPPLISPVSSAAEVAALPDLYPALRLFIDRAQSSNPDFVLTAKNAQAIARICHLLDGIPLAIELAAARVRAMPPQALAARLNDRFQLLVSEDPTGIPRHRTLRALVAWSLDLLSPAEQRALCRLAVFRGGWTLQAAEAVCAGEAGEGIGQAEVLDLLTGLVDKSLVCYDPAAGEERYALQETIRQYAWQLLRETDSGESIQERHFRCYLALGREADSGLAGAEQGLWLTVLERERYNLDAALLWTATTPGREVSGITLAGNLARFWMLRGYWKEGRVWLERLLAHPYNELPRDAWPFCARASNGAGALAWAQGDLAAAREWYERSMQIWGQVGDLRGQAAVLGNLGILALQQNRRAEARRLEEQSLALRRQIEDPEGIANSLSNLGMIAWEERDHARALGYYAESLALRRERNDPHGIATCLNNLGLVACDQGNFARADALFTESEAIFRTLEDRRALAETLQSRADVAYRQQDDATARALAEESIALFRALGERHGLRSSLLLQARLAQRQAADRVMLAAYQEGATLSLEMGDRQGFGAILEQIAAGFAARLRLDLAVQLFAAADAWRSDSPVRPESSEQADAMDREVLERWKVKLRALLGEPAFTAAWMQGRELTPEQALALTRTECVFAEFVSAQE